MPAGPTPAAARSGNQGSAVPRPAPYPPRPPLLPGRDRLLGSTAPLVPPDRRWTGFVVPDPPLGDAQWSSPSRTRFPARERSGERSATPPPRSEEHTSELQSRGHLVCRLLLEKKKNTY